MWQLKPRRLALVLALILTPILAFAVRADYYWAQNDPRSLRYILWKAGYFAMDPDDAVSASYLDPRREEFVIGKTKAELLSRFEYLPVVGPTHPYLSICYAPWPFKGREVRYLRGSEYIIVFDGDRAVELNLVKGC